MLNNKYHYLYSKMSQANLIANQAKLVEAWRKYNETKPKPENLADPYKRGIMGWSEYEESMFPMTDPRVSYGDAIRVFCEKVLLGKDPEELIPIINIIRKRERERPVSIILPEMYIKGIQNAYGLLVARLEKDEKNLAISALPTKTANGENAIDRLNALRRLIKETEETYTFVINLILETRPRYISQNYGLVPGGRRRRHGKTVKNRRRAKRSKRSKTVKKNMR
jgi:hypothetical protein